MRIFAATVVAFVSLGFGSAYAATSWTGNGDGYFWTDDANWTPSTYPTGAIDVQIGIDPAANIIGIFNAQAAASVLFQNSLTQSIRFIAAGGTTDSLTVNGNITNASSFSHQFDVATIAGADATYTGGSAGLTFSNLVIGTQQIATSGSVSITQNTSLIFTINSSSVFGSVGLISVANATVSINGTYTGVMNDTFDFTSGDFSGATIGSLPTLSGSLSWDSSQFLSQGILTVVPEPSTWALLGVALLVAALFRSKPVSARARFRIRR